MRLVITICLLSLTQFGFGQTKGAIPDRYDQRDDSEHFVYVWNYGQTKQTEIEEAKVFAEEVFVQIGEILGEDRMPSEKLIITFGGEGVDPSRKKKRTPHVDWSGRIHLYRFEQGGYLSVLPHEMVHAIRMNSAARWSGFLEEGFASAINYYLFPDRAGFPRFGFQLDLIAGYWLTSGKGIPLDKMRADHNRLNLKCQLQTYVTREDFFNYLATEHGLDKLVEFAYSQPLGSDRLYEKIWDKTFLELKTDWEKDLRARYKRLENTGHRMERYFETTSARYIPVCEPGTDY